MLAEPADRPVLAGGASAYDPLVAMRVGWDRFVKDPATLLVPVIVGSVAQGLVLTVLFVVLIAGMVAAVATGEQNATESRAGVAALLSVLVFVVAFAAFQIVYAGWLKGGLDIVAGRRPSPAEMYAGWSKATIFLTALVLTLGVWAGAFLFWIPSIAVAFLGQFALHNVVWRGSGLADSLALSVRLVLANAARVALFDLLAVAAVLVGSLAFGIGAFVAVPVVVIAQAHTYLRLTDAAATTGPAIA